MIQLRHRQRSSSWVPVSGGGGGAVADVGKDTIGFISQAAGFAGLRAIRWLRGTPQVTRRQCCAGGDKNSFALLPEVK